MVHKTGHSLEIFLFTRPGVDKVKPKVWFKYTLCCSTMFVSTGETCNSFTKFVYPECWHFDNDATSKIDDVLRCDKVYGF